MFELDINRGDIILTGKYRNKREVVKTFGHDENGQPTINGKKILNFRIEKLMPKKEVSENKMKRSELKNIIREATREQLNEAAISDEDMEKAKKIKSKLEGALREIDSAFKSILKEISTFNSPGLTQAFSSAIQEGRPHLGKTGFDLSAALKALNRYYDR